MHVDKVLGLDAFCMVFWLHCWDFVKHEVMSSFKESYDFGSLKEV